ncbi:MAG: hypothetical protein JSR98_16290, partial [Proteobacteria bacterium]|nr:hypothetical protein [Pseudomonadota bacterium]
IALSQPVPVRLFYLTAVPQDGRIVLVPDLYGWDAPVLQLLDRAVEGTAS